MPKIQMYTIQHKNLSEFASITASYINMVYIEILTSHYGLMKEDVFLGHATNAPALFNKGNAAAEFQAFKHHMYIYR